MAFKFNSVFVVHLVYLPINWKVGGLSVPRNGLFSSQFLGDENILQLGGGDGCTTLWVQCHWTVHVKMVNFMLYVFYYSKNKTFSKCNGKCTSQPSFSSWYIYIYHVIYTLISECLYIHQLFRNLVWVFNSVAFWHHPGMCDPSLFWLGLSIVLIGTST